MYVLPTFVSTKIQKNPLNPSTQQNFLFFKRSFFVINKEFSWWNWYLRKFLLCKPGRVWSVEKNKEFVGQVVSRNHFFIFFPANLAMQVRFFLCDHKKKHKRTSCMFRKMQTPPIVSTRKNLILKNIKFSDITFKKTFCLMNIRPQDFLSHEPTVWFRRH